MRRARRSSSHRGASAIYYSALNESDDEKTQRIAVTTSTSPSSNADVTRSQHQQHPTSHKMRFADPLVTTPAPRHSNMIAHQPSFQGWFGAVFIRVGCAICTLFGDFQRSDTSFEVSRVVKFDEHVILMPESTVFSDNFTLWHQPTQRPNHHWYLKFTIF